MAIPLFSFPLTNRKSESGLQEWGIVELQGDLEVRGNETMDNQFIGDLNYDKYGQPVNKILQKVILMAMKTENLEKNHNFWPLTDTC